MIAYFMGVKPGTDGGHYCHGPDYRWATVLDPKSPWAERWYPLGDAAATEAAWPSRPYQERKMPEGQARVVRQDGWTLVCLWDRSGDERGGSHASFAFDDDIEDADAIATVRKWFPEVLARIENHLGREVST